MGLSAAVPSWAPPSLLSPQRRLGAAPEKHPVASRVGCGYIFLLGRAATSTSSWVSVAPRSVSPAFSPVFLALEFRASDFSCLLFGAGWGGFGLVSRDRIGSAHACILLPGPRSSLPGGKKKVRYWAEDTIYVVEPRCVAVLLARFFSVLPASPLPRLQLPPTTLL
jgi:hypothetical protein